VLYTANITSDQVTIGTSTTVRTGVYKSTFVTAVVSETISEYRTLFTQRFNGFRSRHHPITG
jgi:hypothetical protein